MLRTQGQRHGRIPKTTIQQPRSDISLRTKFFRQAISKETCPLSQQFFDFRASNPKQKRYRYPREFKLAAVSKLREEDEFGFKKYTSYGLARDLGVDESSIRDWKKDEDNIRFQRKGAKKSSTGRKAQYPMLESCLHDKFLGLREKGIKIKRFWFIHEAKKLFQLLYPDLLIRSRRNQPPQLPFQFSQAWFNGFKNRYSISMRAVTNNAQHLPEDYEAKIRSFHSFIRKVSQPFQNSLATNRFKLSQIANVDQTPLPFDFTGGYTYTTTGERAVWVKSTGSGMDKRQATVQLTIFADGEARVRPLIIFKGTGTNIMRSLETKQWDPRVDVQFQANSWADEMVVRKWARDTWQKCVRRSHLSSTPILLVLDELKSQRTENVLNDFRLYNTIPAVVPGGCTSLCQPLDVVFNKIFKQNCEFAANEYYAENIERLAAGKISASERRILMTKWVGDAWEKTCASQKESVKRCFQKVGISIAADGSEDADINIPGLSDREGGYQIGDWKRNLVENEKYISELKEPIPERSEEDVEELMEGYSYISLGEEIID